MGHRYRLVGLKNSELLAGLSELVRRGNAITAEELAHLAEIEDRMLHLELGFPSLFAYCVEALGMSEGAAGRRVAAARVCRRFPEAFERVASGDLHLSALCALSPHLAAGNASELFAACSRKSRRQIEELIAARFPRPDVREQIRRLPARAHETAAGVEVDAARHRELEPLSVDRYGVHFTADAELRELIEQARALASHRLPKGDLASLMRLAFETFVREEEKRRFAVGRKARAVRGDVKPADALDTQRARDSRPPTATRSGQPGGVLAPPTGKPCAPPGGASAMPASRFRKLTPCARFWRTVKRSRYLSAAVTRSVYLRDRGRCSFVSADGRRCGARAFLQLDHVEPWAARGAPVAENILILCRGHNLLHARNCFGAKHLTAKIAARRADKNDERTEL